MKLSNEKILNDAEQLVKISQKSLPIKASYAIAKNLAKIESELKIYNKEKEKLIEKYAERDEKGNIIPDENGQIKLKIECIADWNKDIKELLAIENDIAIHKFPISALEGYDMTPAELMLIDYMIEE